MLEKSAGTLANPETRTAYGHRVNTGAYQAFHFLQIVDQPTRHHGQVWVNLPEFRRYTWSSYSRKDLHGIRPELPDGPHPGIHSRGIRSTS
jgi:hypothetical protein